MGEDHARSPADHHDRAEADQAAEDRDRTAEDRDKAFVDVDGLKETNDSRGHAAGDQLLRETAESIRAHLRPYDSGGHDDDGGRQSGSRS